MRTDRGSIRCKLRREPGMDTGSNGIKRNDREPGQQAFDKGFSPVALRWVGGAMNPMQQLRCGDRRNRKVFVCATGQLGLQIDAVPFPSDQNARIDQDSHGDCGTAGVCCVDFSTASQ